MQVLPMQEILKLKDLVHEHGYVLHLHDACGGQSFTLEPNDENPDKQVYEEIEKFFQSHGMTAHFYDTEKLNFVAN